MLIPFVGFIISHFLLVTFAFVPRQENRVRLTPPTSRGVVSEQSSNVIGNNEDSEKPKINAIFQSTTFGNIRRIKMPGEDESSFVGAMGVPTYGTIPNLENSEEKEEIRSDLLVNLENFSKARGLEGVLNHGPAFVLDNVFTKDTCEKIIQDCEELGFGNFQSGKNHHGAMQLIVSSEVADSVGKAISRHIDIADVEARRTEMMTQGDTSLDPDEKDDVRLVFAGLNRRWRIYRYNAYGNETFAPHIDAGFSPSGLSKDGTTLIWDDTDTTDDVEEIVSRLTVLIYLNDDFVGGETNFYQPESKSDDASHPEDKVSPQLIASVRPVAGSILIFPQGVGESAVDYARMHWPLHEGSAVRSGRPKYVIRSDVLFATQREPLQLDDKLWQYDHLVRETFSPAVSSSLSSLDTNFLSHLSSLYNPHMGVENLGPLLYSFIRFTKKRRIVEIGAGYTSLWILQALKENDDEWERIRQLQRDGHCRLLDIEWTIPSVVENFDQTEVASLLCIDNCEHQKETATGAMAVAKSLGLDSYMQFRKGDAFDIDLGDNTVDILWCDFGVGSRIKDFISSAWSCIRPGGFMICHSTLTNQNTREWLEAIRSRQEEEKTGIESDEYVEISLLEPHKRFQNSISILQKRKAKINNGEDEIKYDEPLYSKFA